MAIHDIDITRAIVAIADSRSLEITAEGIEENAKCIFLRECGCRNVQGYLFSRPRIKDEFEALLSSGRHKDFH